MGFVLDRVSMKHVIRVLRCAPVNCHSTITPHLLITRSINNGPFTGPRSTPMPVFQTLTQAHQHRRDCIVLFKAR